MKIEGSKVTVSDFCHTHDEDWYSAKFLGSYLDENGRERIRTETLRIRKEPIRPESQIHLDIYGKQWRLI